MKKNIIAWAIGIGCLAFVIVFVVQTAKENQKKEAYQTTGFAMGTAVTVTVYSEQGETDAVAVLDAVAKLDTDVLSWRDATSEVYALNHRYEPDVPYPISYELASYILFAKELGTAGGGLLDLTIRPLASVWGIEDGAETVLEQGQIDTALTFVDMTKVHVQDASGEEMIASESLDASDSYTVWIDEARMSLDFGAVGKGIACDLAAETLSDSDASGACVAVGGSILCYGAKADGSSYKIGIRNPRGEEGEMMGRIELSASAHPVCVSTSGDYEKYFIQNEKRYHHILNPLTGYPADTGTISATIICENGALSDALSTLCILLDREQALALVSEYGAEAILIDEEKNVYVTDGIRDDFTISNGEYQLR